MSWPALLTSPDGKADEMACLVVGGGVAFIGLAIWAVVAQHQPFSPMQYGEGFGAFIGPACLGMGIKAKCGG